MKELTIEQKARAYDEALSVALETYQTQPMYRAWLEKMFPELSESEDEKVMKEIIELVMQPTWKTEKEFHRRNELCAWLENIPYTIDHEKREGFHLGYKAGLEKQGEKSVKWNENTDGNKPQKNHSVLMKTTHGITEGEWDGNETWIQYMWSSRIKDSDVLFWIELSDIEKKGEQKPIINVPSREVILAIWDLGNEWKELTNGSISTEYGTQLDYIQKHWQESEYYLRAMQDEQKFVDKVEPKFKHGDRVRNKKSGLEQTLGNCIEDVYEGAFPFRIKDQDDWELVEQKPIANKQYYTVL